MNGISSSLIDSALKSFSTNQEIGITVLKKAIDISAQSATTLIEALPKPVNLPANLGNSVNTTA